MVQSQRPDQRAERSGGACLLLVSFHGLQASFGPQRVTRCTGTQLTFYSHHHHYHCRCSGRWCERCKQQLGVGEENEQFYISRYCFLTHSRAETEAKSHQARPHIHRVPAPAPVSPYGYRNSKQQQGVGQTRQKLKEQLEDAPHIKASRAQSLIGYDLLLKQASSHLCLSRQKESDQETDGKQQNQASSVSVSASFRFLLVLR